MAYEEDLPRKDIGFTDPDLSSQNEEKYYFGNSFSYVANGVRETSPDMSQDWKANMTSPGPEDTGRIHLDNNQLKLQVKQLTADLQAEQDTVSNLRKRLNSVERDRLEAASNYNKEVSDLESQITKLRATLEKGEASKANTDFELTRVKRELAQQRHSYVGRESSLEKANDELRQKLSELGDDIKKLEEELQQTQSNSVERERQLRREIELRDSELSKKLSEQEVLHGDKDKLEILVQQHENTISELNEKLQYIQTEKKHETDNLRRTLTELEYCREREDRVKKDMETALQRLRAIEESIECERAAHLETKFNSEIVQLRVRDIEGALDVEKSANSEANKAIDRLSKQIRELEGQYKEERKNNKIISEKLARLEKEHVMVKKQLTNEVDNKKTTIGHLSKELEIHQKNFTELKDELSKARKRQIYLEETYGGSMRELELLLQNFQITEGNKPTKKSGQQKGNDKMNKTTTTPSVVLENLRLTLADYRKRLDNTLEELTKMKKSSETLNKEIDQCKEMIWAKDKALEDAQKSYTRTAKELNRVRSEYGELETLLTRLKVDMQSTATNQSKDRTRIQELSEEIMKLVKKHKADEEEKLAFLHGLYQRLLTGKFVVAAKEKPFNQFSWQDLTTIVYDQVVTVLSHFQNAQEKIYQLEDNLKNREVGLKEEYLSHEGQMNKLSTFTKEREMSWQKQKQEMEDHYQQLLNEMQTRLKKSQTVADQAWEKIRSTGTVQQSLESECAELQDKLADFKKQNSALLATCSLLIGAFYPLYSRASFLTLQRRIMEDQLNNWDVCRERVELLVHTLTSEMNKTNGKPTENAFSRRSPILAFRKGAIAVLAANRLKRLGHANLHTFIMPSCATGQNNILVCTGSCDTSVKDTDGDIYVEDRDKQVPGEAGLLHWLNSSELLHTLVSSTAELMETISQVKGIQKVGAVERRAVVNAARNSFTRLFDRLGRYYEGIVLCPDVAFSERNSLFRLLGRGLIRVLKTRQSDEIGVSSPQELMISLQTHILEFTQRLHSVEVERRTLSQEVNHLQEELEKLGPEKEELLDDDGDIAITQQGNKYVPIEKFESICVELNNALRREEQAQHLLNEQSKQLEELSTRLDIFSSEGMEKEQTLSEAIQGLAETKLELRRKEQTIRQLNKQLAGLEGEKDTLCNNLCDAEKALRTVAKDKDILTSYIQTVETALIRAKHDINSAFSKEISLSKLLLNADFIPKDVGKAGQELIACQNLVGSFVDTQHHLIMRITNLEDEIESNRHHVSLLKQELSDAVRREHEQFEFSQPTKDKQFRDRLPVNDDDHDFTQSEFTPLREDSEISFHVSKNRSKSSLKNGDSVFLSSGLTSLSHPTSPPYRIANLEWLNDNKENVYTDHKIIQQENCQLIKEDIFKEN